MFKFTLPNSKKIFESDQENNKKVFLKKFLSTDKSKIDKDTFSYIFRNFIEDRITFINSLNDVEFKKQKKTLIAETINTDDVESTDLLIKKFGGKINMETCPKSLKMISLLKENDNLHYDKNYYDFIAENDLNEVVKYFIYEKGIHPRKIIRSVFKKNNCNILKFLIEENLINICINNLNKYLADDFDCFNLDKMSDSMLEMLLNSDIIHNYKNYFIYKTIRVHEKFLEKGFCNFHRLNSNFYYENYLELRKNQRNYDIAEYFNNEFRSDKISIIIYAASDYLMEIEKLLVMLNNSSKFLVKDLGEKYFNEIIGEICKKHSNEEIEKLNLFIDEEQYLLDFITL